MRDITITPYYENVFPDEVKPGGVFRELTGYDDLDDSMPDSFKPMGVMGMEEIQPLSGDDKIINTQQKIDMTMNVVSMSTGRHHLVDAVSKFKFDYVTAFSCLTGEYRKDFYRRNYKLVNKCYNDFLVNFVGCGCFNPAGVYNKISQHDFQMIPTNRQRRIMVTRDGFELARYCGCGGWVIDSRMHLHKCHLTKNPDWAWRLRNG